MKFRQIFCITFTALLLILSLPSLVTAGKKSHDKPPDYSMTERKDVPVEYTWRVEDIYPDLEEWKKEKAQVFELVNQLTGMSKDWTTSPQKMLALLELKSEIEKKGDKLYTYASLQNDTDLSNPLFQQMKGEIQNLVVQFRTKISFMEADILQLAGESFARYVQKEPGLEPYVFTIANILRTRAHVLPADQEKIYSYTGLFSDMPGNVSSILNNVDMPSPEITLSDGEKVTLNYANYVRYRAAKNPALRALVMKTFWQNHKKFENTFAALLDGAMKQHLFDTRIHNYSDCLEAVLFKHNIDPAVYHKLIQSTRENLQPLHRYLKVKQEILDLDQFKYEDIYASAVKSIEKIYTFEEARQIILDMMGILGNEYSDGLTRAFNNRWIDRYPNKNKESGAYSSSIYGIHPYIKMNYNGKYDSLSTLAHELGHAMHSYFANRAQHFANSQYSNFLAEIASTFNENILVDYLLEHEKDDLFKLFILDAFLQRIKGTVYRQVHFSEFELAMHRHVEAGSTLTADWLNKKYLELARYYYGHDKGVTEVGDYIQNEWARVPHFFYNYYVYTYSTGMIASTALAHMVLKGPKAGREKYLDFLKTGGSRYPLETLRLAGVDITTDKPFQIAFQRFNHLVSEMETIVRRLKKNKKI
ncbi:MAG: oligoendopeptidase F [Candidatus Aminicenantes bacterium]|nr:MAG: oligoendopeptidase F [Candidatus Aminicenantes bacterium]